MTETINLVDKYKFIEKDLSSPGSMTLEIDGWMDGWMNTRRVREELALGIPPGGLTTQPHPKCSFLSMKTFNCPFKVIRF